MTASKNNGQVIGYRRVSSEGQNLDRQLDGLQLDHVFEEKISGKDTNRPELQRMIEYARKGDTVVVHSLDRLGRSLIDVRQIIKSLTDKGVKVRFSKEGLEFEHVVDDNSTEAAMKNLMLNMLGSFAEFERALIKARQAEGIKLAKAAGKYAGRSKSLSDEQVKEIKTKIVAGVPKSRIAAEYGVTRATLYKYL